MIVLSIGSDRRLAAAWVCRLDEIGWRASRSVRGELRNIQISDHLVHHFGVNHSLLHGAGERKRIEAEVVDVPWYALSESGNVLVDSGGEQRLAFIAGDAQPMLNVIFDLARRQRNETMNN